ncbi:Cathepsin B [Spironucleus salmonicida]|uniref:Cathepsin B n=1 Tax=Spironucleus salmonicida TaxID=348837 RepID=A0A9P8LMP1_9EUKA|nr:Cathepsin B [Spironucleus salmonicida]
MLLTLADAMLRELQAHSGLRWVPGAPTARRPLLPRPHAGPAPERYAAFVPSDGALPLEHLWPALRPECSGPDTVRDQGSCGSCWAFSAVDQLADNRCIAGAARTALSEQYVVSCNTQGQEGCNGGWLLLAQQFLVRTGTVADACAPYTSGRSGATGKCPRRCEDRSPLHFHRGAAFEYVCQSERSIMEALLRGTVQTAFTVYGDFDYYHSGVYEHVSGGVEGSHAVMLVGWGVENDTPYWLLKNSWGSTWGEGGYFKMIRGVNECNVEDVCFLIVPE